MRAIRQNFVLDYLARHEWATAHEITLEYNGSAKTLATEGGIATLLNKLRISGKLKSRKTKYRRGTSVLVAYEYALAESEDNRAA